MSPFHVAIISAVVFLCTFVVKDILVRKLKDRCESLTSAETKYVGYLGQSGLSVQMLNFQQQLETNRIEILRASHNPDHDYSSLILQNVIAAQQVKNDLAATFKGLSDLIDALPARAQVLRQSRDKMREEIQGREQEFGDTLKPTPQHGWTRLAEVKLTMVAIAMQEAPVLVLGDAALSVVRRMREAYKRLLAWSTGLFWFLGLLGAGLAIYAAMAGIKLSN